MKNKFETARLPNRKVKGTTTALRPWTCALLYVGGGGGGGGGGMMAKKANRFSEFSIRLAFFPLFLLSPFGLFFHFSGSMGF